MNLADQQQPSGMDLSGATLDDLVRELKSRFIALALVGLVDDDETGEEKVVTWRQGGRVTVLGMIEDYKHDVIAQGQKARGD